MIKEIKAKLLAKCQNLDLIFLYLYRSVISSLIFFVCLFLSHSWWWSGITPGSLFRSHSWIRDHLGCWRIKLGSILGQPRQGKHLTAALLLWPHSTDFWLNQNMKRMQLNSSDKTFYHIESQFFVVIAH